MKLIHTINHTDAFILAEQHVIVTTPGHLTGCAYTNLATAWDIPVAPGEFYQLSFDRIIVQKDGLLSYYDSATGELLHRVQLTKKLFAFAGPSHVFQEDGIAGDTINLQLLDISTGAITGEISIPADYQWYVSHPEVVIVSDEKHVLMAIEIASCKVLWEQRVAILVENEVLGTTIPPSVHGHHLFCYTKSRKALKVDVYSGRLEWSFYNELVQSTVPAVYNDTTYFAGNSHILAINASGEIFQEIKYDSYVKEPFYNRTYLAITDTAILLGNPETREILHFNSETGNIVRFYVIGTAGWSLLGYLFAVKEDQLFTVLKNNDGDRQLEIYSLKPDDVS
ncbi:PQQ-like domain-containing protein [Chitinophaga jiangningensis]|uniref:PQQ-like domain-containing protein n=1 Tax=Chitinophaga jiangningensis TaxID=1419482 RepID=A0A1M6YB73_9BACT|nr:PQQ-binding-like beta-propeller repeat protein [Chitinophaga jiangningensis]SHL15498.1 PQQ-like domain-containing protein [Chitinophaga jiangningensis]